MLRSEAMATMDLGCDHPPRFGGWCHACDAEMRAVLLDDYDAMLHSDLK